MVRQVAAEKGRVAPGFQFAAEARRNGIQVGVYLFQVGILLQEVYGGLFANAGYAGNVIRSVARHGFKFNDLVRGHAHIFGHFGGGGVVFGLGLAAAGQVDDDPLAHQLQQVAVAGDDFDPQTLGRGLQGDGAQDVVGLKTFQLQPRKVKCIHHLADALDLRAQVIGHLV